MSNTAVTASSPKDIIADVKEGLYVTEFMGFGVNMVTGDFSRGASGLWISGGELTFPVEEITAIYIKEITEGVGETGIRAGAVKIATGAHHISDYERKLVIAGARAARETGVPLISHTQEASCGHEQIDLVTGEGVAPHRLVVGHE